MFCRFSKKITSPVLAAFIAIVIGTLSVVSCGEPGLYYLRIRGVVKDGMGQVRPNWNGLLCMTAQYLVSGEGSSTVSTRESCFPVGADASGAYTLNQTYNFNRGALLVGLTSRYLTRDCTQTITSSDGSQRTSIVRIRSGEGVIRSENLNEETNVFTAEYDFNISDDCTTVNQSNNSAP